MGHTRRGLPLSRSLLAAQWLGARLPCVCVCVSVCEHSGQHRGGLGSAQHTGPVCASVCEHRGKTALCVCDCEGGCMPPATTTCCVDHDGWHKVHMLVESGVGTKGIGAPRVARCARNADPT